MINFRFHVVSLSAVFVALAIGLVVGTAARNGPASGDLRHRAADLGQRNGELRGEVDALRADVATQRRFAEEAATLLLPGRLAGRRTALIVLPGGAENADAVVGMLATGGAKLTGRVELTDRYLDPASAAELLDLATRSVPPGIANALPPAGSGVEASSALLAAVVLQRAPAVTPDDTRSVLSGYASQKYLTVAGGSITEPAEAVVVVAGPPATGAGAGDRSRNAVSVVDQLAKAGHVVVAGTAAGGDGGPVAGVRAEPRLEAAVSTVDNAATPQGRLAVVLALVEKLAGRTGHYGGGGGTALIPKPVP